MSLSQCYPLPDSSAHAPFTRVLMSGGSNGVMAPGRPQRTTQTYRRANTSINLTGAVADSDLFRYGELVNLVA